MPPQEGVGLRESFTDALYRCLEDECGLAVPETPRERSRFIHLRSTKHLGTLELPRHRWDERGVADDAAGTALEHIEQRKKAYWAVVGIVRDRSGLEPQADGVEVQEATWLGMSEARRRIAEHNRPEKAQLLLRGLGICERHL